MSDGDASLPLQKAIVATLRADSGVRAMVWSGVAGQVVRVFDSVPTSALAPYVSMGPFDVLTEDADDYEGSDTSIQIDGWSEDRKGVEIKKLGRAIRTALHNQELSLDENQRLVSLTVDQVRYLEDADLTQHVAVTLRARTEPSA